MKIIFLVAIFIKMLICDGDRRIITTLKYSRYYIKPFIVNGSVANQEQVPYLVSIKKLHMTLGPGRLIWTNLCGGSIISESKILTAAHCFEDNDFYYRKNPKLLRIVGGNFKTDLVHSGVTETTKQGQWRSIAKILIHRDFHFPNDDIALVFINKPWDFTNNVDYILPASRTTDYAKSSCYSAGYGSTDHYSLKDSTSKVLLVAKIDPMPRVKCSFVWQLDMDNFVCTNSLFSDVATGDSGGPLACSGTLDPKEELGRDVLVGVVSGKNFDKTTIFTRVSSYKDWIKTDRGCNLEINCYLIVITLMILIYVLFHLVAHRRKNRGGGETKIKYNNDL